MRVLLSAYAVSPSRGGEPGNSWKLAEALARRGIEVDVLCTPPAAADRTAIAAAPPSLRLLEVGHHVPPIDPTGVIGEYRQYVRWQRASVAVARAAMAERRYDVVHHYSWGSLVWGSPLWRLGVPMVFGPVGGGAVASAGLLAELGVRDRVVERCRRAVMAAVRVDPLARSVVRRSTVLVSERATGRLVASCGGVDPLICLQDTVDPAWLASAPSCRAQRGRKVLWAARMLPKKGPTLAVRTLALLPSDVTMTMVGEGPELDRCRRLAVELGVFDRVEFAGRVSHDRLRLLFDEHAVFLFSPVRDTFGGQVAEAAARGTPVVAIRQHGVGDHVPPSCGVLAEPGSVESTVSALARGVEALLDGEAAWNVASQAARAFATDFTTDHRTDAMLEVYERVVSDACTG